MVWGSCRVSDEGHSSTVGVGCGVYPSRWQEDVFLDHRVDELHQDVDVPARFRNRVQEFRNFAAVDVVAAAFEQGFRDMVDGRLWVVRQSTSSSASFARLIKRVHGRECLRYSLGLGEGQEPCQCAWAGECLLYLFKCCEVA
jgi:hypothetical protein